MNKSNDIAKKEILSYGIVDMYTDFLAFLETNINPFYDTDGTLINIPVKNRVITKGITLRQNQNLKDRNDNIKFPVIFCSQGEISENTDRNYLKYYPHRYIHQTISKRKKFEPKSILQKLGYSNNNNVVAEYQYLKVTPPVYIVMPVEVSIYMNKFTNAVKLIEKLMYLKRINVPPMYHHIVYPESFGEEVNNDLGESPFTKLTFSVEVHGYIIKEILNYDNQQFTNYNFTSTEREITIKK